VTLAGYKLTSSVGERRGLVNASAITALDVAASFA
jgi:hypothetical protein